MVEGLSNFVHNAPPEDHDLKREYLALLPPQQVIDICLRLDVHVPMALKRNIWPTDFRAVLASMQNKTPKVEDAPPSILPPATHGDDQPPKPSTDPKPPDNPPTAGPSTMPVPPLQPFAYVAAQAAYAHSYYPGYPYPAYPPGAVPGVYPQPYTYPGAPPFFTTAHPPEPTPAADDGDLPSYEDMIVEGLTVVNDPEGLAPKDLFNWIYNRWPTVQANFRPSASQALQKAYRRNRFEKSTSGKYRLNPNWSGGSSSTRRATRRPQTQSAAAPMAKPRMPSTAPYTAAPRLLQPFIPVPPRATLPTTGAKTISSSSTPFRYAPPTAVPAPKPNMPPNASNRAYQAAQKILQTINFGAVFDSGVKAESVSHSLADHARADLQAQLALVAAQLEEIAEQEAAAEADAEGEDDDEEMDEVTS
ncbi:hypothetical protein C8F01DRAFT_1226917 [Mycena amicta]|nr:hypothetical protein C8F01DRAFT_1226917 [Mycena amicta]